MVEVRHDAERGAARAGGIKKWCRLLKYTRTQRFTARGQFRCQGDHESLDSGQTFGVNTICDVSGPMIIIMTTGENLDGGYGMSDETLVVRSTTAARDRSGLNATAKGCSVYDKRPIR